MNFRQILSSSLIVAGMAASGPVQAGILDAAGKAFESLAPPGTAGEDLATDEITNGLIEALKVGTEKAVASASAAGGFLDNPEIRIPLPEKVRVVGDTLRRFGMGGRVDAFEETMNRAAEKASAEALPVLGDAVSQLTFEDAQRIWKGGDTAATDYFREKTWEGLYERFKPVVHDSARQVGVTRAYQDMTAQPMVQGLVAGTTLDLDHYVTDGALSGLFELLAAEEKKIRTDPVARTTDLLKKVFGSGGMGD